MRNLGLIAFAAALLGLAVADVRGGETTARPKAEVGFAALREAATKKDEATLTACLPTSLVEKWPEASEESKWRAALAARIAEGSVVSVREDGDGGVARWKTASAVWELPLRFQNARWVATSPWAYCVGGETLAKANGKTAHLKLKARQTKDAYGPSGFSFVHVTQDPRQCKNRIDACFCQCGQVHFRRNMVSRLKAKKLDEVEGLQSGGDWMDEIVPKNGAVYVLACKQDGRADFQVALQITSLTDDALERDWRLVAAGKNAPPDIHKAHPATGGDGEDGTDQLCDPKKK